MLARVRDPFRPRIGRLRHHPPEPLEVPAYYLSVEPPEPAPTIAVVTPSYQQSKFIERTIRSVVGQRYPALEYVVQDGGSTDGTVEILRRFDAAITTWTSEKDGGQADAINRGFSQTSGEIMAWLNSDDMMLPGALAYVARYFAEHPEVDVVYGDRVLVDENDGKIGAWILPSHDDAVLALEDFVPQETVFWRRRVWEAVDRQVDPTFRYALDWDLLLRFREVGANIVHLSRFLGAFRVHDGQKTTVEWALGSDECARLRLRVHGRELPLSEIEAGVSAYRLRHLRAHLLQRIQLHISGTKMVSALPPRLGPESGSGVTIAPRT
jgi:glycosyltransferase involved in cell wall biosynthesis